MWEELKGKIPMVIIELKMMLSWHHYIHLVLQLIKTKDNTKQLLITIVLLHLKAIVTVNNLAGVVISYTNKKESLALEGVKDNLIFIKEERKRPKNIKSLKNSRSQEVNRCLDGEVILNKSR